MVSGNWQKLASQNFFKSSYTLLTLQQFFLQQQQQFIIHTYTYINHKSNNRLQIAKANLGRRLILITF